jgi:carbamoyl-phosphate synthase small subunit
VLAFSPGYELGGGCVEKPAILALADGSVFHGRSIGYAGQAVGEVVFNTSMSGYQEIITDPSYAQQLITFTYPHIGNVGCNKDDEESSRVWANGIIVHDLSMTTSNWRAEQSLADYLQQKQVVAIAGIDTRHLTHILREKGALGGCIVAGDAVDAVDESSALAQAKAFAGLAKQDLAKVVTTPKVYVYEWKQANTATQCAYHVVVYDYGVKRNILSLLAERHCRLTVVPATTSVQDVLALKPDGVFLSNGPGDPAACDYAIAAIKQLLDMDMPLFGICLGHQLLALASGANTLKMKFGHHGANHPVQDLSTQRVFITSQNHGFTVDENHLPPCLAVTHRSLFDNSVQGVRRIDKRAFGFQGHPEASPGPHDIHSVFDQFIQLMQHTHNQTLTEVNYAETI